MSIPSFSSRMLKQAIIGTAFLLISVPALFAQGSTTPVTGIPAPPSGTPSGGGNQYDAAPRSVNNNAYQTIPSGNYGGGGTSGYQILPVAPAQSTYLSPNQQYSQPQNAYQTLPLAPAGGQYVNAPKPTNPYGPAPTNPNAKPVVSNPGVAQSPAGINQYDKAPNKPVTKNVTQSPPPGSSSSQYVNAPKPNSVGQPVVTPKPQTSHYGTPPAGPAGATTNRTNTPAVANQYDKAVRPAEKKPSGTTQTTTSSAAAQSRSSATATTTPGRSTGTATNPSRTGTVPARSGSTGQPPVKGPVAPVRGK